MSDPGLEEEIEEKIEEIVERKVGERLEGGSSSSAGKSRLESVIEEKVEERLSERLGDKVDIEDDYTGFMDGEISRRSFLKVLGLGAGGAALVSAGAGASLVSGTTINGNTAWHQGNDGGGSGLDADRVDGEHASAFSRAQNGGQNIWVQSTAPTGQSTGDIWIDTS